MQETPQRFARIRRSRGVAVDGKFLSGNAKLTIPPQTNASILIDQNHLTIAYPELAFSGGDGAKITITYNEALFDSSGKKGHRDSVNNRVLKGLYDVVYPDGLTLCAYPGDTDTRIPPLSLIWNSMLHDCWQWRGETDFIRPYQDGIHGVLAWFETHIQDGLLTDLPDDSWDRSKNWRFDHRHYVDDTPGFPIGVPPGVYDGQSTLVTLMYVYALQHAADLMQVLDDTQSADRYQSLANDIKIRLRETSWNAERQLLADTPKQQHFSQHTKYHGRAGRFVCAGRTTGDHAAGVGGFQSGANLTVFQLLFAPRHG